MVCVEKQIKKAVWDVSRIVNGKQDLGNKEHFVQPQEIFSLVLCRIYIVNFDIDSQFQMWEGVAQCLPNKKGGHCMMFVQRINVPSAKNEWHFIEDGEDLRDEIAR